MNLLASRADKPDYYHPPLGHWSSGYVLVVVSPCFSGSWKNAVHCPTLDSGDPVGSLQILICLEVTEPIHCSTSNQS